MPRSASPLRRTPADCALAVFAKAPIPGAVKTRLVPPLTADQAAQFHAALVEDTLSRITALNMIRYLACAPDCRQPFLRTCAQRYNAIPIAQGNGDLGDRMQRVVKKLLARHRKVLLIGTDSPTLPLDLIVKAERQLDLAELVFGPSEDGGYYLIGQRRLVRTIFHGIAWGSATVLADSLAQLDPLRVALLPEWYDVDRPADLRRLQSDRAGPSACPRTRAWLRRWEPRSRGR